MPIYFRIKELRKIRNYSQDYLAQRLCVDRSTIAKWEAGTAMPSAAKLPRLAAELDCTIDELYAREPPGKGGA